MIIVPFSIFCGVLTLLCLALCGAAVVRLARTAPAHPDRPARLDTVRLLGIVSVASVLALVRTQFLSTSRIYMILSIALIPFGIFAIGLTVRLFRAYRHDKERPPDQTLPDLESLQSRISPLAREGNNDDSRRNTGS